MNFKPHAGMKEDSMIATVGDLVPYLQKNFKPEDKQAMLLVRRRRVHELRACKEIPEAIQKAQVEALKHR